MQTKTISGFQLSPQQKRLWLLQQDSSAYLSQCAIFLEGALKADVLKAALERIIHRHGILRTSFCRLPGVKTPVMVVEDKSFLWWQDIDLSDWHSLEHSAKIEEMFQEAICQSFDFEQNLRLRLSLVKFSKNTHILHVCLPALCADTWTLKNLVTEISTSYGDCLNGETGCDEVIQYLQFSEWQNQLLKDQEAKAAQEYWERQKLSSLATLKLPFESTSAKRLGFEPSYFRLAIAPEVNAKLERLAQKYDTSVAVLLLACWQTLIWRLTGYSDIVIGTASDRREFEELHDVLGIFATWLPICCHLAPDLHFTEVIALAQQAISDGEEWQDYFVPEPLENNNTLAFPIGFEFEQLPGKYLAGNVSFSLYKQYSCIEQFKVKLTCTQDNDSLSALFYYDINYFCADTIQQIAEQFQTLLASAAENPEVAISQLEILSKSAQQQLLVEFNQTQVEYPKKTCIHELFEQQVLAKPNNIAVVFEDQQLTYAELNAHANQLAHHLLSLGVGKETIVALYLERSLETFIGLLGILKAGGAYLPLDSTLPNERLTFLLQDAQASVILTQQQLAQRLSPSVIPVVCLDTDRDAIAQQPNENLPSYATLENLVYVIYTSGSMGKPKGVAIEHQQLYNYLHGILEKLDLPSSSSFATVSTFAADLGNTTIFSSLCTGGCLHIISQERTTNPEALSDYTEHHPIDCLKIVPSHLSVLLATAVHPEKILPRACLILGGEAASWQLIEKIQSYTPSCQIINHYGPTEATVGVLTYQVQHQKDDRTSQTVPLGRPLANTQIYLLDVHHKPVPIGVPGELHIGGAGLARSYLNQPELTREKFIPNPFNTSQVKSQKSSASDRLYKTGDRARYLPDGNIEFLGRIDNQVKIRGFRIELGEIEAILGQHPKLLQSAVITREDTPGDQRLVAYLVAKQQPAPTISDLRHFLQQQLPEYMIPNAFVVLDALPLTANGKVDRLALPMPQTAPRDVRITFVAPKTAIEEILAGIWGEVLVIEQIGLHDNFFDLGGHSLQATQLISRVRIALGVELPLRSLFEHPTVAELAECIEIARRHDSSMVTPPLVSVARNGNLPLSFAQARLWFLDQLEPESAFYNISVPVRLRGRLNVLAVEQSLNKIISRHEALRTNFVTLDGQPVQVIAERLTLTVPLTDLQHLSPTEQQIQSQQLVQLEAQQPFDLASSSLVRAALLKLGEAEHILLLTMHHIISDGWSRGILVREFTAAYKAYCNQEPLQLPELPIQYADFAMWQQQWLQAEVRSSQLAYWKQQLQGAPPLLELPTDRLRPNSQSFRGGRQTFALSSDISDGLMSLSRRQGVTLFMTLLAGFQTLLYRYSGQDDICIGTPIANRNHAEIEGLIGFFANTLVLRTDLSGNPSFEELLLRVRDVALGAYAHQDLPFEQLVEALQPERSLSYTPLFQVMFILQNAPMASLELPGLTLSPLVVESATAKFDLTLSLEHTLEGLSGSWEYNTDLFDAATIARLADHFQTLLTAIVANPQQQLSDLPLLSDSERHQLLEEWNNTQEQYTQSQCIHQLFEAQVEKTPDAVAIVFEDMETSPGTSLYMTYRELNQRANQLAHHLQALGVKPEVVVGICVERSLEMVVGSLGILKSGGAYLPLDPQLPQEHLEWMLASTQVSVLLSQQKLVERLCKAEVVCLDSDWNSIEQQSQENPTSQTKPENLAYILYSSKQQVLVEHRSVAHRLDWLQNTFALSSSDVTLSQAPLTQNTAIWEILWPLLSGGRLVIAAVDAHHNLGYLQHLIAIQKVSVVHFFPSTLAVFVDSLGTDATPQLSSLRWVFSSGERLRQALVEKFFQYFTCGLYNFYSLPEAAGEVTCFVCQAIASRDVVPIGHPTFKSVYILDQNLQPVPLGVKGEIYVGGIDLFRGYLQYPAESAQRFVKHPFLEAPNTYLFKTGDLGRRLHDGTIELVGSINRHAWIQGFRVELQEVEAVLLANPSVVDCRVLVRETETFTLQLVAYVVLSGAFSPQQLQSDSQALLPTYMQPYVYVPLSTLPRTLTGQVDEHALASIEVIDSNLIQRWEEQLRSLPEIEQVAVVVKENTVPLPPLHLKNLLLDSQTSAVPVVKEAVTTPVAQPPEPADLEPWTLAISDGGSLTIEEDAPQTLTEALLQTASRSQDKVILYIQADGSQISQTYGDLLEEARCILTGLSQMGFKAGDKAILQIQSLRDYFPTLWACILGGITPVTVAVASTYKDKNAVVNKLFHTWQLLGYPVILASDSLVEPISHLKEFLGMEQMQVLSFTQLCNHPPSSLIHQSHPEDVVFFQLTSGSTGVPKCIQETHRGIITHIHAAKQFNGYQTGDISLNWLPMDHVVPVLTCHFKDTYLGCQQVAVATDVILSNPLKWLDLIETYQVTHTWSPNFGFKLISNALAKARKKTYNLSSIKFFMNAGEQVTFPVVREFLEQVSPFGVPANAMQPAFGMAEVCTCMTYQNRFDYETGVHRIQKSSLNGRLRKLNNADEDAIEVIDLGPPVPGVQIRITDKDNQVLPEEMIGRLQIKGNVVTPGYLNNEAANQEAFVGHDWFNSGDLGFILNGHLYLTGREKELIRINGVNYYCYEIEDTVNEIDRIEPTYVAACGFNDLNRGTEGLAIFFTPRHSEFEPDIELIKSIRAKISTNLGITPTYVVPVAHGDFPKTTSGKIQRTLLKKWLETGYFQEIIKAIDIQLENENTLPDWFYRKIWYHKEATTTISRLQPNVYLVFLDELGLGMFVCKELERYDQICIKIEAGSNFSQINSHHYCIDPTNPDHYQCLLESLVTNKIQIAQILHLWTYDNYAGEVSSMSVLEQAQERGVYSLLFLVQALAKIQGFEQSVRLQVISSHTQFTSPTDKIAYEKSPIVGIIKTIPQEMPWLTCCHIDLPENLVEVNGNYILQELCHLSKEPEVAYRNGKRLVSCLEKVNLSEGEKQPLPFKQGGIYLISGGLGGIGVEIAKYLLTHYQARLLVVGRTSLSQSSTKQVDKIQAYQALKQLEGEVIYEAVDICNLARLQQIVEQAQSQWEGELDGIIHLAGIFQERMLVEETHESLAALLRPKMLGTWVLHQLMKDKEEGLFINFSSVNGFFGGTTVGAYAAASSFLEGFGHYQKSQTSLQSYCFAWSMWDEIGMSHGYHMKELTRARGYYAMTASQGLYSLLAGLHHDRAQLLVGLDGTNRNLRRYIQTKFDGTQKLTAYFTKSSFSEPELIVNRKLVDCFGVKSSCNLIELREMPLTETGAIAREHLIALDSQGRQRTSERVAPRTRVEHQLVKLWQEMLNVPQIGIYDNFFELGGHSLLATQLISRLREVFSVELTLRQLFESPTVENLSEIIEEIYKNGSDKIQVSAIKPVQRNGNLPLSFAQARLWFLDQLEPESAFYNISVPVRLRGRLNVLAVEQSLNKIISRHEALRTNFVTLDGQPVQVIAERLTLTVPLTDLQHLSPTEQQIQSQQLVQLEAQQPFDLASSSLVRAALLKLGEAEHILLLTMHHIISDGWSRGILVREFTAAYKAYCNQEPLQLPELPIQYADFAMWQQQWLQAEVRSSQLAYWKQQLQGAPPLLELPTDRLRPNSQSFRGGRQTFTLSSQISDGLMSLSHRQGVTLFMTLLAGFQTLLYRYSGQDDICIGTPIANRNHAEIEGLIGFFANTLVLRTDLSGNPSFEELLLRVRDVALGAYAHQDLPFEQLVEALQPERSLSYTPLFQVMFVLQNAPMTSLELPGLTLSPLVIESATAKFDLFLSVEETKQGLSGSWEYNTDLFDAATIARLTNHFQTLLTVIVDNPQQRLSNLPLLSFVEQQQLLFEWNNTETDYPQDVCIHQLFEAQVEKTPDAVAAVFEDVEKSHRVSITYRELNQRANKVGNYLQKLGVGAEVLVGICMERSLFMLVGLLGILKAGGAYVPLDPTYPQERLTYMVKDSQVSVLLTQQQVSWLPEHEVQMVCIDTDWVSIDREESDNLVSKITPENLAYAIYTSGSTGIPKAVLGVHRATINRFHWMWKTYPFEAEEICCQKTSLSFVDSVWEIFGPLLHGVPTVIIPNSVLQEPNNFLETLARNNITRLLLVPSLLRVLLDTDSNLQRRLPNLKLWVTSGEALSIELLQSFQQTMPESRLLNLYGSSEVSADVTCSNTSLQEKVPSHVFIGQPIANIKVYLLDDYLQPVPIGVKGELYISGEGLNRGYLYRPELTAEKFIPHPFSDQPGTRLYKTGDLARYFPDGNLEFLGRVDRQGKLRGFRIELGEIEAVLGQHVGVQEAVVLIREDQPNQKRIVAYVVFEPASTLTTSDLGRFLKEKLPEYMVPAVFVVLNVLPLLPNGKVNRRALPAPDVYRPEQETIFVAPQTPTEEKLAEIWSTILGIEQVGIYDNFFALGGHSLMATQLMSRICNSFGVQLLLRDLFISPTINNLAQKVDEALLLNSSLADIDVMLDQLEGMDEDEAQRMSDFDTPLSQN